MAMNTDRVTDAAAPATTPAVEHGSGPLATLARRILYWVPVFAALALFAQIAFLGLRPALCEAARLAAADEMLQARYAHDQALFRAYDLQILARQDPIFRERQRRLQRTVRPPQPGV